MTPAELETKLIALLGFLETSEQLSDEEKARITAKIPK